MPTLNVKFALLFFIKAALIFFMLTIDQMTTCNVKGVKSEVMLSSTLLYSHF